MINTEETGISKSLFNAYKVPENNLEVPTPCRASQYNNTIEANAVFIVLPGREDY